MTGRENNFDGIRLLAALAVLFTHAFVIAEGSQQNEPFVRLTDYQCPIGLVGVFVFFVISGYLITQSWFSTKAGWHFLLKRALRIFPGLFVSLLVCAFVIGPLAADLPMSAYIRDERLVRFLTHNALLELGDNPLPGVLFSANTAGDTVNGSLWTLRYEFIMYIMVLALGVVRLLRLPAAVVLLAAGILALFFEKRLDPFGDLGEWAWFLGFFAGGMALYFFTRMKTLPLRSRERGGVRGLSTSNRSDRQPPPPDLLPRGEEGTSWWLGWPAALFGLLGLVVADECHLFIALFPLFGGLVAISAGLASTPVLRAAARFGDLSYGTYIYGWPVEQCVMRAYGGHALWWQVFLWSVPITLTLAWVSWHGVETWAIRLGKRAGSRIMAPHKGMVAGAR